MCSATLTMDKSGRLHSRKKDKKKKKEKGDEGESEMLDQLCLTLKFKSRKPKVIDLTATEKMPSQLQETFVRCRDDEKDLYLLYFLQEHAGESTIVFANSITCVKRVSSVLTVLKIKNQCLHSKMQQKQRLKSLD